MPFRQFFAALSEHHRQVTKLRRLDSESLVEQQLNGRIDHVIAAPANERDAHRVVVDDAPKIVERHAIRANQNDVLNRVIRDALFAEHEVIPARVSRLRRAEPNDVGSVAQPIRGALVAPPTGVTKLRFWVGETKRLARLLELFFRRVAAVSRT